jgi:hypothetical protein
MPPSGGPPSRKRIWLLFALVDLPRDLMRSDGQRENTNLYHWQFSPFSSSFLVLFASVLWLFKNLLSSC